MRWGCRIKQNWLQEPIEGTWQSRWYVQVTGLICDRYASCILYAAAIWGCSFAHREQNLLVAPLHITSSRATSSPHTYLGNKSDPKKPHGEVSYFLCSLIKNPEEEDPTRRICTRWFEGVPPPPGSWLGNIVNRNPPRGDIFFHQI